MYGYVYKIIFPAGSFGNENESFYIGQKKSSTIIDTYFGSGNKIRDWFKKRGLNSRNCNVEKALSLGIKREILAEAETYEELNLLEYKYIEEHLGNISCLNLISGGKMPKMTTELRQKISEKTKEAMAKDEVYNKYIKAHREYYIKNKDEVSKTSRERIYQTRNFDKMNEKNRIKNLEQWADPKVHEDRRKKMAAATGKKVICVETGQIFDSARNAEATLGIQHVLAVCYGSRKTAGGLHFMLAE